MSCSVFGHCQTGLMIYLQNQLFGAKNAFAFERATEFIPLPGAAH